MRQRVVTAFDIDGSPFLDPALYSRYKYGSRHAIDHFAAALAALAPAPPDGPVTITAPASRAVPIGADLLADGVLRAVNHRRATRATRAKLHRSAVPDADYGTADAAGRRALLAGERISGVPELFAGRDVIVVDDLWVTGISAEVTVAAIARWSPRSVTYLVIARIAPDRAPRIEFDLNHAAVDSLAALGDLCRGEPVTVNQRMCKFVLGHPPDEVRAWLDTVPATVTRHLSAAALAEGFTTAPRFAATAGILVEFAGRGVGR